MALRRPILPSRLTGAPVPDAGVVTPSPAPKAEETAKTEAAPAVAPAPQPVETPAPKASFAGIASQVFNDFAEEPATSVAAPVAVVASDVPPVAPALTGKSPFEDWERQQTGQGTAEPVGFVAAAPAPALEEPFVPVEEPQQPVVSVSVAEVVPGVTEEVAGAPAFEELAPVPQREEEPVPVVVSPVSEPEPAPQPAPAQAFVPQVGSVVDVPVFQVEPVQPETAPQGPTNFLDEPAMAPSRPDGNNGLRRRVREKRARDFGSATQVKAEDKVQDNTPRVAFAANVPVDSRPLDRVDEALIATGIVAPPPVDSLTTAVPTGLAVEEFMPRPEPEPLPAQVPVPQQASIVQPSRPVKVEAPQPPKVERQPEPVTKPEPAPELPAAPAFTLSRKQENQPERVQPLPPPQPDTPAWAAPSASGEWDLPTTEVMPSESWQHEGAPLGADGQPAPSQLPPPADVYKPAAAMELPPSPTTPWGAAAKPGFAPPELPSGTSKPQKGKSGNAMSTGLALAALAAVGVVVLVYMKPQSSASSANAGVKQLQQLTAQPSPTSFMALDVHSAAMASSSSAVPVAGSVSSTAQIAFADVDPNVAQQPITADNSTSMPKDISIMARLQAEIAKARSEKEGTTAPAIPGAGATVAEKEPALTPEALKKELEAYRRTLAESPTPVKPSAFKKATQDYMDGSATRGVAQTATADVSGAMPMSGTPLLPPPDTASAGGNGLLPPPELYAKNPKNLPIVPEPVTNAPTRVRTLADFAEADMASQKDSTKVAVPQNLKPHLSATEFPKLEILSFIPGKGIIAYANGREGVLLIGENLNGWSLAGVNADSAEFRAGRQSRTVTTETTQND